MSSSESTSAKITATIKTSTENFTVPNLSAEMLISEVKEAIAEVTKVPAEQQRLIYKGHILKDPNTLGSYGFQDQHTIHMVKGAAAPSASSASSTGVSAAIAAGSNSSSTAARPAVAWAGPGAAPTAAPSATPASTPAVGQLPNPFFASPFGAGGMPNPADMGALLNNPMVDAMLSNPEFVRTMMQANPQVQELIRQNPEMGHLLNDPQILRQSLEMARNPSLMQEMLRNQDRAMSNIEMLPGGFEALARFHQSIGGPLQDALSGQLSPTTTATTTTTGGTDNPQQQQQQQQQQQLPANGSRVLPNPFAAVGQTPSQQPQQQQASAGFGAGQFPPGLGMGGMNLEQMLSNPMYQSMMQSIASNPQLMETMMRSNPMLSQTIDSNPMLRERFGDPTFMRAMLDPANLQAIAQLQRSGLLQGMSGGFGGMDPFGLGGFGLHPAAGSGFPAGNAAAAAPAPAPVPAGNPEEIYATELRQLEDMGFTDRASNIRALVATQGNVQFAIERLLG